MRLFKDREQYNNENTTNNQTKKNEEEKKVERKLPHNLTDTKLFSAYKSYMIWLIRWLWMFFFSFYFSFCALIQCACIGMYALVWFSFLLALERLDSRVHIYLVENKLQIIQLISLYWMLFFKKKEIEKKTKFRWGSLFFFFILFVCDSDGKPIDR